MSATCRSCGAPVVWARHGTGRLAPFDAQPQPHGEWLLVEDGKGELVATRRTTPILAHVPHHATCPQAADWRRR